MSFSRETVAKSFLWKLFERFSVQIIQFVVTIVLARLIVPSEYGIISLIAIFIQLCEVIIEGGLNTALVQKKDADNKDFSTIFCCDTNRTLLLPADPCPSNQDTQHQPAVLCHQFHPEGLCVEAHAVRKAFLQQFFLRYPLRNYRYHNGLQRVWGLCPGGAGDK